MFDDYKTDLAQVPAREYRKNHARDEAGAIPPGYDAPSDRLSHGVSRGTFMYYHGSDLFPVLSMKRFIGSWTRRRKKFNPNSRIII